MTREDLEKLLAKIAPPGEKREEKLEAVKELGLKNNQKHGVELTLESYKQY